MKKLPVILFIFLIKTTYCQLTPFEKSHGSQSATYFEAIQFYKKLSLSSSFIRFQTKGLTDAGYPLNLILISGDKNFDPVKWHSEKKIVLLINNGIHPGEPDGIDASMMLSRDIVNKKIVLPSNVALAIIPVYNIGGALNRSSFSRANQNGPEAYGFRGNAQNLDLNRDFIKCDSKNARSFEEIFHYINPDIFIDNHVSDGADYQHVMTLITTQYNKLGGSLGQWVKEIFVPVLFTGMKNKLWDMVPYVNVEDDDPSNGFTQFYDSPRYSSGYAALFGTISFMPETHMLKPYKQRVLSTYDLMHTMIEEASLHAHEILFQRKKAIEAIINQKEFPLKWTADTTKYSDIIFKGYEAGYHTSEATQLPVLFYDHTKPFDKHVKFFDNYKEENLIKKPKAYIIPQGWWLVIGLLKLNDVHLERLKKDSAIEVMAYHINDYKSYNKPYEKHHKNYDVSVSKNKESISFLKGDYIINVNQPANRYIIETLEPTGDDGFFTWNFFDEILQQKEGYSDYRWDTVAAQILKHDSLLNKIFIQKKLSDTSFLKSSTEQLSFIYKNSIYFETEYLQYPVFREE